MGLGIRIGSEIEPRGILRRRAAPGDVFRSIAGSIPELIGHPLHEKLARITVDGEGVDARLHPSEEPVEFRIDENGMLTVSAKTSSAGPGYHAFLVDLLDGIGEQCGLAWIWDDEEKEFLDETGYAGSRDFPSLQREMANWLCGLAGRLIELKKDGCGHLGISMPLGFDLMGDYFAISSMGYWDRAWFESAAKASEEVVLRHASDFFPWWGKGRDATFWQRCALVDCWVHLGWHPPKDEGEVAKYRTVLECLDLAKAMDPRVAIPEKEIQELELILAKPDSQDFLPAREGIGFRRRMMRRPLTGGWSIRIPGYYYEEDEDDGSTVLYWYAGRTVRGSSFRKTAGDFGQLDEAESEGDLRFREGHLTGSAAKVLFPTSVTDTQGSCCTVDRAQSDQARKPQPEAQSPSRR